MHITTYLSSLHKKKKKKLLKFQYRCFCKDSKRDEKRIGFFHDVYYFPSPPCAQLLYQKYCSDFQA